MVGTHHRALPPSAGPSNDPLPAKSEAGVRPARPRGVLRPQHRHLPLRHPHREDVQGPPGEDGRQNQVVEETLVRFWPSQAELLLLRGWGRAALTACLSVCLNSSSSNKQRQTGFFFQGLRVKCAVSSSAALDWQYTSSLFWLHWCLLKNAHLSWGTWAG